MPDEQKKPNIFLAALPTIIAVAALEILNGFKLSFPYPGALLLGTVIYAAFIAGAAAGWISTVITLIYGALAFTEPGRMFVYSGDNLTRVISLSAATPMVMLAVCAVRKHVYSGAYKLAHQEAKVAVDELVEDQQYQLTTILEQLPFGVVVVNDVQCKIGFANMKALELLGHNVTEFHPYAYHRMFHTNGQPFTPDEWPLLRAFQQGEILEDEEFLYADPGGHLKPMWCRVAPIRDVHDKIVAAAMIFRDLGERRRVDTAQRELAAILSATSDAIFSLAPDSGIINWNPAAERIFGYTAEEVKGRPFRNLVPAHEAGEVAKLLDQLGRGEEISRFELLCRDKTGELKRVEMSLSPLPDATGQFKAATAIAREVVGQTMRA